EYGRRQQREQEQPSSNWKMILAGVAVVVVVALIAFLVSKQFQDKGDDGTNPTATTAVVPDVVGQLAAAAKEKLATDGFSQVTTKEAASSADNEGKVTKQDPGPSTT